MCEREWVTEYSYSFGVNAHVSHVNFSFHRKQKNARWKIKEKWNDKTDGWKDTESAGQKKKQKKSPNGRTLSHRVIKNESNFSSALPISLPVYFLLSCMHYSRPTTYTQSTSISHTHTHTRAKHSQIGFMVFNASQKQTKQIDKRAHTAQTLSFFHSSASAASTELERRNARWAIECVTSHKSQHSDSAPSTRKWYFWFYLFCLTNRTAQRHQCRRIYCTVFSSGRLPLAPLSSLNSAWVRVWHECCDTQIQRISNFLY